MRIYYSAPIVIISFFLCFLFQNITFAADQKLAALAPKAVTKVGTISQVHTFQELASDIILHFAIYVLDDGYSLRFSGKNNFWKVGDELKIANPYSKNEWDHDNDIKVTNLTCGKSAKFHRLGFTKLESQFITEVFVTNEDEGVSVVLLLDSGVRCKLINFGDEQIPVSTWKAGQRLAVFVDSFNKDPFKSFSKDKKFIGGENCVISLINWDANEWFVYEVNKIELSR